ncbi:unnamed protein product [Parascedosporium putredinis]|uniref:Uncharacterized protein n=1 Tax=Parascedosporium putredinis TaxID=1442378 RepID=A0A9P1HBA8_9PEZI|nr:unnamed protein product [Parascedosporium putredinis]CAI8002535.1 unnamed protein product [Parascedosporium putredinis]
MAAPVDHSVQAGAAAPPAAPGAAPGPIDNADVEDWKNRVNDFLAKPAETHHRMKKSANLDGYEPVNTSDKEAEHREALLAQGGHKEQYATQQGMSYPQ